MNFRGVVLCTEPGSAAEFAKRLPKEQSEAFRVNQDEAFESDSERDVKRIERGNR